MPQPRRGLRNRWAVLRSSPFGCLDEIARHWNRSTAQRSPALRSSENGFLDSVRPEKRLPPARPAPPRRGPVLPDWLLHQSRKTDCSVLSRTTPQRITVAPPSYRDFRVVDLV